MTAVFQEAVERLVQFRPSGVPVLSLYVEIPYEPGALKGVDARFTTLLASARRELESEELDHEAREALRSEIRRLAEEVAPQASQLKGRGLAVFACHRPDLLEQVVLPRPVPDRVMVDATPYLRPLLAVLDEYHRYCVAVVDREHAWIYAFFMGRLEDAATAHGRALREPNYAGGWQGWKEDRTHHKAEALARRHYRQAAACVDEVMRRSRAELLILGGHPETVAEFLPFLPHQLQPKVAGTFAVDPATMSVGQLRERADEVASAYERQEERQLVADTLDRVAAGGLAAAGLEWCLTAVNEQAVQLLLVHDDEQVPGRVSDRCGWLGLEDDDCPVCGEPTRKTPDVIDEMATAVVDTGGRVEHVYAETPLDRPVVAARLRFPVPDPRGI